MPTFLADHVEQNNLQGKLRYSLFVGASSGAETENRWAELNMIERRSPHQVGKAISKGINNGQINFFDKHLSMFPVDLVYVSNLAVSEEKGNGELTVRRDSTPRTGRATRWMWSLWRQPRSRRTVASSPVLLSVPHQSSSSLRTR